MERARVEARARPRAHHDHHRVQNIVEVGDVVERVRGVQLARGRAGWITRRVGSCGLGVTQGDTVILHCHRLSLTDIP